MILNVIVIFVREKTNYNDGNIEDKRNTYMPSTLFARCSGAKISKRFQIITNLKHLRP